ncbi:glycosyltransferase family 9 protein [Succinimonas sp.]|uniref:glycosyltransferase family 9 protein n=1 Tax=Succinimonas sp. TaxID=1936151 RepID=UPI00386DC945
MDTFINLKHGLFHARDLVRGAWGRLRYDHQPSEKPFELSSVKRAVINRIDGKIGDSVCFAPFLRELSKHCPDMEIVILANESMRAVYNQIPGNFKLVMCSKRPHGREVLNICKRIGACDFYVHLVENLRSRELSFIHYLDPIWVATLDPNLKMDSLRLSRHISSVRGRGLHITQILNCILSEGGISDIDHSYVRFFEREVTLSRIRNTVCIVPYGSNSKHRLSDESIKLMVDSILKIPGVAVEIFVVPGERSHVQDFIGRFYRETPRVSLAPLLLGMRDVFVQAASYRAIMGVDTGTAHIAASYGIPEFTMYPDNIACYNRWYAINDRATNILYDCVSLTTVDNMRLQRDVDSFIANNFN